VWAGDIHTAGGTQQVFATTVWSGVSREAADRPPGHRARLGTWPSGYERCTAWVWVHAASWAAMTSSPCSKAHAPTASMGADKVRPRAVSWYSTRSGAPGCACRATSPSNCGRRSVSVRTLELMPRSAPAVRPGAWGHHAAPRAPRRSTCWSPRGQSVQSLPRGRVADVVTRLRRAATGRSGLRGRPGSPRTRTRVGAGCGL
jgi:hypothetical protein